MDENTYDTIIEQLEEWDFDLSKLKKVPQEY
jgi:hypothetical protein